jgi:hypothetical protein
MHHRAIPVICGLLFLVACVASIGLTEFPGIFDELEHISYAARFQETGSVLPSFEEQRTLSLGDMSRWDNRRNYLAHPSPFYVFVALVLDRSLPPAQAILAPRLASAGLLLIGVIAALDAGRRQFGRDRLALLLFCLSVGLCPKLIAVSGQVSNDSLAFLGGALAYWGASEDERSYCRGPTAIGLGLLLALWAKLNAGLAVGAFAGIFLLLSARLRFSLLLSVGIGIVVGSIPYLFIVTRYGRLVPLAAEDFGKVIQLDGFATYLPVFLLTLGNTWGISHTGAWPITQVSDVLTIFLFWAMIAGAARGSQLAWRYRHEPRAAIAVAGSAAFVLVVPIHLWFASTSLGFSLPAASFRYYLPLWPPLAHAIAFGVMAAAAPWRAVLATISFAALIVGWLAP